MGHRKESAEIGEEPVEAKTNLNEDQQENGEEEQGPIEERKELIEDLFERAEAYAKTNVELFKLRAIDKLAEIIASLISRLIIITIASFFFLMINIGLAVWLGEILGQVYYGFFIVAGIYALISILLFVFRDPIIKYPIINSILTQVLKQKP